MSDVIPEEQIVNSIIGPGSKFKGDIVVHGLIRIDGDFSGTIKTKGKILVGQYGRVDGALSGRIVVVGGIVRGNIYAEGKVIILADSVVIGNIHSPRIVVEETGILHGHLVISGVRRSDTPAYPKSKAQSDANKKSRSMATSEEKKHAEKRRWKVFSPRE
ncbi:bactofilin family protein [Spirochaeta lutea]|uniref:bactofilin family protein n=1 Tax=Spirochaeta lutea TaxID=1480694 RepID=UPI0009DCD1E5|nr:polymer-forming cytoskeletal protein [Spirochaeta lutea]